MKKTLITLAISFCILTAASAFDATVISAKGKAEVLKGESWVSLKAGSSISKGDVIQTGFKSEVILKLKETVVTVAPLSRITMEQLAEKKDKDESKIFLDTGSLKSDIKKSENRRVGFQVRSPVATASVRGTVIDVTNTYGGMNVDTISGVCAMWRSSSSEAEIATEEEDAEEPAPASEGTSAQDISDGAPKGAITVSAGEAASVSVSSPTVTTPQTKAADSAVSLEGTTTTAASQETTSIGGSAVATTTATDTAATASTSTPLGKLAITISVK